MQGSPVHTYPGILQHHQRGLISRPDLNNYTAAQLQNSMHAMAAAAYHAQAHAVTITAVNGAPCAAQGCPHRAAVYMTTAPLLSGGANQSPSTLAHSAPGSQLCTYPPAASSSIAWWHAMR